MCLKRGEKNLKSGLQRIFLHNYQTDQRTDGPRLVKTLEGCFGKFIPRRPRAARPAAPISSSPIHSNSAAFSPHPPSLSPPPALSEGEVIRQVPRFFSKLVSSPSLRSSLHHERLIFYHFVVVVSVVGLLRFHIVSSGFFFLLLVGI